MLTLLKEKLSPSQFLPLLKYKTKFESSLNKAISELSVRFTLRDACAYSLQSGGKRLRPILVMLIAEATGNGIDVTDAALAIEYFHTASLILDDLPAMDNDDFRRGKPALHIEYGETIALLASNSLLFEAFHAIHVASEKVKALPEPFGSRAEQCRAIALERASNIAGIRGATAGQFYDLFPPDSSLENALKIIELKTVTFFEGAFTFGWIFGGGDPNRLDDVTAMAKHFGMAFQIADDIDDMAQDESKGERLNLAGHLGRQAAEELFEEQLALFDEKRLELNLDTPMLRLIRQMMCPPASS
ncbi:MAG: Farnesyl diphosphate synthase [Chlamydiia bacterium]|nr:Farnesyl diphosphate synthase [Chlamydiia bacterium]